MQTELETARARLAEALANPGDDKYSAVQLAAKVSWLEAPSFCESPKQADYEEYRRSGNLPAWNPGRHKSAKNPVQCETAFMQEVIAGKFYREDLGNYLKNVGAGIINSVVNNIPGVQSNLGDQWSGGQAVGQVIGGVASLVVNPLGIASKAVSNMSFLGSLISGVGKAISSPLGQVATNFVSGLVQPAAVVPQQAAQGSSSTPLQVAPQTIRQASTNYLPNIAEGKQSLTQALTFGDVKDAAGQLTRKETLPWWGWLLIGLSGVGLLALLFIKKR